MHKEEIRSFGDLAAPRIAGESRTIEGYAIVFNQESRVMYDKDNGKFFTEVIEPRAVTEEFLRNCDIKLLVNHNKERLLARSYRGSGSLIFEIDNYGVKYQTEAAHDADGDAVLEHVRRGDYFGSSFVFYDASDGVAYNKIDKNTYKRTVSRFAGIADFSIVSDPAYFGTTVTARNWEQIESDNKSPEWSPEMECIEAELNKDMANIYANI